MRIQKLSKPLIILSLAFVVLGSTACGQFEVVSPLETTIISQGSKSQYTSETKSGSLLSLKQLRIAKPVDTLNGLTQNGLPSSFLDSLRLSDVAIYEVEYTTTNVDGTEVRASGAILLPLKYDQGAVMTYLHATLTPDRLDRIPSKGTGSEVAAALLFAALGYYVVLPDYLGYGASADLPHPYLNATSASTATIDLLSASQEAFQRLNRKAKFSEGIYIAGYSQGAQAGMALHRDLERTQKFSVAVSSLGAGPYDIATLVNDVSSAEKYPSLRLLAWAIESMRTTHGWALGGDEIFKNYSSSLISDLLVTKSEVADLDSLFQPNFLYLLKQGSSPQVQKSFIDESPSLGWAPKAPMKLFHGRQDDVVPFQISSKAYLEFQKNQGNVSFRTNRKDHEGGIPRFFLETLIQFTAQKEKKESLALLSQVLEFYENEVAGADLNDLPKQVADTLEETFGGAFE